MRRLLVVLAACSTPSGVPAGGGGSAVSEPRVSRDAGPMAAAVARAIGRGDIEGFVVGAPRAATTAASPCGPATTPPAGALVYVDGIVDPPEPRVEAPAPVEVRFAGCVVSPRLVLGAGPSGQLAISTVDPVRHEATLALAPAPGGTPGAARRLPLVLEGQRFVVDQTGPGVLHIGCALHESERAALVLPAHRHHALVDHEGRFRLSDVPAGKHKLVAWSPEGRRAEGEAIVVADGMVSVTLTMP